MVGMQIPLLLVASFALASSGPTIVPSPTFGSALLGAEECGNGPSYWCQTFKTAKTCNAMQHCIHTVWEHQVLPVDDTDICKLCKDMVTQARDQLESNETQEELKEVFEGSCKLIPIKPVSKECCKLADDFIPELIEALSSQMNPQMVCSVAGLCNSARIIPPTTPAATTQASTSQQLKQGGLDCAGCRYISGMIEKNFQAAYKNDILNMFIEMCGKMGSFSDGCSAIMITYFDDIYNNLKTHLKPTETCHIAGVCSPKYHIHADRVDTFSKALKDDDLPCELCEQLVQHLADVLVANTTEQEFEQVLLGICGQTKSFKDECVNIVREYYPTIYEFLTKELDGKMICKQIGICQVTGFMEGKFDAPLYPMIPADLVKNIQSSTPAPKLHRVSLSKNVMSVQTKSPSEVEMMQLPIERLVPQAMLPRNKEACEMCEYFLHYIQVEITDPMTEAKLKVLVEQGCNKLPQSVAPQCREFIETYGDAFISILTQQIDPSQVCPSIGVCPGLSDTSQVLVEVNEKPTCPLCLMTMETVIDQLKDNKTEAAIRIMLDNICQTMPKTITQDCIKFIDKYMEELIDMIVADFTPQEICVYAKLCDAPKSPQSGGDVNTNEIPDTIKDEQKDNNQCVLCEFVMTQLEKELQDKKTEEEIKQAVLSICHIMPSTVKQQCNKFVEQYADLIIELLATSVDPKGICIAIKLCKPVPIEYKKSTDKCLVCESFMGALLGVMEDEDIEMSLNKKMLLACDKLPKKERPICRSMIIQLGPQIENLIRALPVGPMVCHKLSLCHRQPQHNVLLGAENCTWGPGYWCQNTTTAAQCNAVEHCQTKVWMSNKPKTKN